MERGKDAQLITGPDDAPRGSVPPPDDRSDVPAWVVAAWRWVRRRGDWAGWPRPWSAFVLNPGTPRERVWSAGLALVLRFGPNVVVPAIVGSQSLCGWPGVLSDARLFGWAALAGAAGLWGTILARREIATFRNGSVTRALAWSCENSFREVLLTVHPVLAITLTGWPGGGGLAVYGLLAVAAGVAWTVLDTRAEAEAASGVAGQPVPKGCVVDQTGDEANGEETTGEDESIGEDDASSGSRVPRLPGPGYWVWHRGGEHGEVSVLGEVCVDVRAGARVAVAHVPLFPPWPGTPHCFCRVVGGEARVTCLASTHGARLEIKRSGDLSRSARIWIEVRFEAETVREAA